MRIDEDFTAAAVAAVIVLCAVACLPCCLELHACTDKQTQAEVLSTFAKKLCK